MLKTAQEIIQRFEGLESDRSTWEATWQDVSEHIKGSREFLSRDVVQGRKRNTLIYDNTGVLSGDMLAAGLHNFLTNTATQWYGMRSPDDRLMQIQSVTEWFDQVTRIMNARIFNNARSRFVPTMHQNYTDLVFWCTSNMIVEEVPGIPVRFSSVPLSETFVAESASGIVDTVFRSYELTNRQAATEFGNDTPKRIMDKVEKSPEAKTRFLHLVHRRDDPVAGSFTKSGMPWRSVHVSLESKEVIRESGFRELPYMVSRWEVDTGETYGRGPGINAISECKMANTVSKTLIKATQKATDPPLLIADDGIISPVNINPGGVMVVRSSSFSNDPIRPLPDGGNLPIGNDFMERRQTQIRSTFMHDLLQLLQDPRMTATQVLEVSERAQSLIAPVLGRLQVELLEPMLTRCFGILARRGEFPTPPLELQGTSVEIQYISPVQRAQMASEVRAITNTLSVVAPLAELRPDILDNIDFDAATREIAMNSGASPKILRSKDMVMSIRQARAEQQAEQQQRRDMALAADVASKAAPLLGQQPQLQ